MIHPYRDPSPNSRICKNCGCLDENHKEYYMKYYHYRLNCTDELYPMGPECNCPGWTPQPYGGEK